MKFKTVVLSIFLLNVLLLADEDIYNESLTNILNTKSELKADVGSRSDAINYLNSNTPVDVITYKQIENSGLTSLTNVLRYFVAGFNAPETSVADGSDHVRAFTIRGMSPDQILVLVNGKRLHSSALLHVNGTIGRGSNHADLDTIAIHSIQRIEIMRDGASAQYGSDAIAGVINIVLKGMGHKSTLSAQYGKRSKGDGRKIQADTFISIPLDYDGFINLTMEATDQNPTQRAGKDNRVLPPKVDTHVGIAKSTNYKAVLNAEILKINNIDIYSNAIFNYRDSSASAFYRPPNSDSANTNGFLPIINAKITDYSFTLGVKGRVSDDTTWNLSNTQGLNDFHFYVNNSMNYTLNNPTIRSFDNGALTFTQNTTNLDISKSMKRLKISGGLEYRYETYEITPGELASYTNNNNLSKPAGSQGFNGFTKDNAVDSNRHNVAIYMDSIANVSDKLSLEVLARYEEYSDFGESTNAKIAVAYHLNDKLLFRTSGSTGFRAPSLAQSFYSQTSSFVNNSGVLVSQGTFKTNHEVSKAFGATNLVSERSKNFSIGSVYQPTKKLFFMLDLFYIDVHNKILLTNELSAKTQEQQNILSKYEVSQIRYFTNAAQTTTKGFDFKINYDYKFKDNSKLNFGLWFNYASNNINNKLNKTLNDVEKIRIEDGQPKNSLRLLTNYKVKKTNIALNISRDGKYSQMIDKNVYYFDASWTADLDISYKLTKNTKIAIGGNNIFNTIANKWSKNINNFYGTNAIKPYSRYSPFGYSGAYYYLRASMEF